MTLQERINFLQRYMIVHAVIYYELDNNIVDDRVYDAKAKELVRLKNENPELWKSSEYYKQFGNDYNGSTGFTLYHDLDEHQKTIILSIINSIYRTRKGD